MAAPQKKGKTVNIGKQHKQELPIPEKQAEEKILVVAIRTFSDIGLGKKTPEDKPFLLTASRAKALAHFVKHVDVKKAPEKPEDKK